MDRANLTPEGLAARLPLLNLSAVCLQAGVDYMRLANWQRGRVKSLTEDELARIAAVLETLHPGTAEHTDTSNER
jgi:hypothetical protein